MLYTGIGVFLFALFMIAFLKYGIEIAVMWLVGVAVTTLGCALLITSVYAFGVKVSATPEEEAMERGKDMQANPDKYINKGEC